MHLQSSFGPSIPLLSSWLPQLGLSPGTQAQAAPPLGHGFSGIDPSAWLQAPQFAQGGPNQFAALMQQMLWSKGPDNQAQLKAMLDQLTAQATNHLMTGQLDQAVLLMMVLSQLKQFGETAPGQQHRQGLGPNSYRQQGRGGSQNWGQQRGMAQTGTNNPGPAAPGTNGTATFDSVRMQGQRNQMVEGRITVNGRTYNFRSGGGGRGNLPPGQYQVTRHMDSRSDRTMQVGGVGYSFALNDAYDSRVGGTRSLLRIHPDGAGAGTIGCIGIVGDAATQAQFRQDMLAEIQRNGGSYTLNVG